MNRKKTCSLLNDLLENIVFIQRRERMMTMNEIEKWVPRMKFQIHIHDFKDLKKKEK